MNAVQRSYRRQNGVTIIELMSAIFVASVVLALLSTIYLGFIRQYKQRQSETRQFHEVLLMNKQLKIHFEKNGEVCIPGKLNPKIIPLRLKNRIDNQKWHQPITVQCYQKGNEVEPIIRCKERCQAVLVEWEGSVSSGVKQWPVIGSIPW